MNLKTFHQWTREEIIALLEADLEKRGIKRKDTDEIGFVLGFRSLAGARLYRDEASND